MHKPFIRVPGNINGELLCPSVSNLWSEQLMKMMIRPDCAEHLASNATSTLECNNTKIASVQETQKAMQSHNQKAENSYPECAASKGEIHPPALLDQTNNSKLSSSLAQSTLPGNSQSLEKLGNHQVQVLPETNAQVTKLEPLSQSADALSQCQSLGQCNDENLVVKPTHLPNLVNDGAFPDQNSNLLPLQTSPRMIMQGQQLDTHLLQSQQIDVPQVEYSNANGLFSYPDDSEWSVYPSPCQPLAGFLRSPGSSSSLCRKHDHHPTGVFSGPAELTPIEELWNNQLSSAKCHLQLPQQDLSNLHMLSNSFALKDLSEQSPNQSDIYSCLNFDGSNSGSTVVDPSISSTALDEFSTLKNADFHNPSDFLVSNLSQDVQSQLTSASLADSQGFSLQEFVDNSGGASSSNVEFDDSNTLANNSSWQQAAPRVRTYTKVMQLFWNS